MAPSSPFTALPPRLRHRIEEHQPETVAPAFAQQLRVQAEQEFEHRPAAHSGRLVGIAAETEGDRATLHFPQPIANPERRRQALARQNGVLDTGQLPDEAPAAGDDQAVVRYFSDIGEHHPPAVLEAGRLAGVEFYPHAPEEAVQRHRQIFRLTQAGRNPDQAGLIDEFCLPADDGDFRPVSRARSLRTAASAAKPVPMIVTFFMYPDSVIEP